MRRFVNLFNLGNYMRDIKSEWKRERGRKRSIGDKLNAPQIYIEETCEEKKGRQ